MKTPNLKWPLPIPPDWTEADIEAERARVERAVTTIVARAIAGVIVDKAGALAAERAQDETEREVA